MRICRLKTAALTFVIALFLLPNFTMYHPEGDTVFEVMVNGQTVGRLRSGQDPESLLMQARRRIAKEKDDIFYARADLYVEPREDSFAHFSSDEEMTDRMEEVLRGTQITVDQPAYSVKVGTTLVNVRSLDQVRELLQSAIDGYQDGQDFVVTLTNDEDRQINVLKAQTIDQDTAGELDQVSAQAGDSDVLDAPRAGLKAVGEGFAGFDYGLKNLYFANQVEVVESYLSDQELTDPASAAEILTHPAQEQKIYEVQSGDTLSEIALSTETPLDTLIALNEDLEDENSTIRVGQELIITSPVPPLSIGRQEELYYEENYEAEIEYIYNDNWYTTDKEVRQAPSAGHRKVAARKTYWNDKETDTEILMEEVTYPAVPKIVEVGTKVPPTFIKPIPGGRISSPFGRRKAPKKGASTYHKGIDWATPVGTTVVASSGGVVERAGWGSGYGYVVYINHEGGKQTRYGHLSKVLVKPGDRVSQGQKIALSGNTGRSTGPHIHFEILVNGAAVNPLNIIN
ncbi:MAG: M23 family metallopeptidase [Lachnospiraceae bacterium]|nr:M23 family metallopeptidase [Lachnospiraceae bacterium]